MGVFDFGALAKQRVGFVEEQNGVAPVGFAEDAVQVFFRFANVFADHLGEVNFVQFQAQFAGNDFGGHGFAGAGRAGEKDVQALAERELALETPVTQHDLPQAGLGQDFPELLQRVRRQDNVFESVLRLDFLGETR